MNHNVFNLQLLVLLIYSLLIPHACSSSNHLELEGAVHHHYAPRHQNRIYKQFSSLRRSPWKIDDRLHAHLTRLRRLRSIRRPPEWIRSKYRFVSPPIRAEDPNLYDLTTPLTTRSTTFVPETTTAVTTTSTARATLVPFPFRRSTEVFPSLLNWRRPTPQLVFKLESEPPKHYVPLFRFRETTPKTTSTTTTTTTSTTTTTTTTRKPQIVRTTTRRYRTTAKTTTPILPFINLPQEVPEEEIGEESVEISGPTYDNDVDSRIYYQRILKKDEQLLAALCPNLNNLPVETQRTYSEVCEKLKDRYQPKPVLVSDDGQDVVDVDMEEEGHNGKFNSDGSDDVDLNEGDEGEGYDEDIDYDDNENRCTIYGASKAIVSCLVAATVIISEF